jgi:hypothetical protein
MGYIENGKYKKGKKKQTEVIESSSYKSWDHDVQRSNHRHDMIQPWNNEGKLDQEFIDEYLLKDDDMAKLYNVDFNGE